MALPSYRENRPMLLGTLVHPGALACIDPATARARLDEARRQQVQYLLASIRDAGRRLAQWLHVPPASALRHS